MSGDSGNEEPQQSRRIKSEEAGTPKSFLELMLHWIATNPIKSGSVTAILLGFSFQLVFWISNDDMPRLGFEDLTTVFGASAVIGLFLLLCLVLPLFSPAIFWTAIRSSFITKLSTMKPARFDTAKAEREWRVLLTTAAIGGAVTIVAIFGLAYCQHGTVAIASLAAAPLACLVTLLCRTRHHKKGAIERLNLCILGAAAGFGGTAIALPAATIIQLLASNGDLSIPKQWFLLLLDPLILLFCSWALSLRDFKPKEYAGLITVAAILSAVFVLIPMSAHLYIAQSIARMLGQGAQPDVTLIVTAEECGRIRSLSNACACQADKDGNHIAKLAVLNRQGDSWLVEVSSEKVQAGKLLKRFHRLHIPREQILDDGISFERSAVLIERREGTASGLAK